MKGNKWYFTFGIGHLLHDYTILIHGSYEEARTKMFDSFGCYWCEQYPEEKGEQITNKYGYKIIEVV